MLCEELGISSYQPGSTFLCNTFDMCSPVEPSLKRDLCIIYSNCNDLPPFIWKVDMNGLIFIWFDVPSFSPGRDRFMYIWIFLTTSSLSFLVGIWFSPYISKLFISLIALLKNTQSFLNSLVLFSSSSYSLFFSSYEYKSFSDMYHNNGSTIFAVDAPANFDNFQIFGFVFVL